MAEQVHIFEMGPRDGLQNERQMISTQKKVQLVNLLSQCGFEKIEVTSFVSPMAVPQMSDAASVLTAISRKPGVKYAALTPNLRGYSAAKAAKADEVAIFASASEGFSQRNINCSIAESFHRFEPVMDAAARDGIPVRGYVSCITDCPYDGPIAPEAVAHVASKLLALGCYEVSLGDTIGAGTPQTVAAVLDAVLKIARASLLAGHFHDTKGRALDNIAACLDRGMRVFDSSVGGLGGCPFAPGARGNVATEAVLDMLESRGFSTGLDRDLVGRAAAFAQSLRTPA